MLGPRIKKTGDVEKSDFTVMITNYERKLFKILACDYNLQLSRMSDVDWLKESELTFVIGWCTIALSWLS